MQRLLIPVTIANGTALSGEVFVDASRIVGIQMPAGWDAANITLQASLRGSGNPVVRTFGEVVDTAGAEIVLATAPAANEYVALPDTMALLGLGVVKVRSGTVGVPVNQTAERSFFLVVLV